MSERIAIDPTTPVDGFTEEAVGKIELTTSPYFVLDAATYGVQRVVSYDGDPMPIVNAALARLPVLLSDDIPDVLSGFETRRFFAMIDDLAAVTPDERDAEWTVIADQLRAQQS